MEQESTTERDAPKSFLVTTRLNASQHETLSRLAAEADRTLAAEVRRAVKRYLESLEAAA